MKIAVLASLEEDASVSKEDPPGRWDDLDDRRTVDATLTSLRELRHTAQYFPVPYKSISNLVKFSPDPRFNTGEGHISDSHEAQMPGIFANLHDPYTGAELSGMSLSHNKAVARETFRDHNRPSATFRGFAQNLKRPRNGLHQPPFLKPAVEGSSIAINDPAVIRDRMCSQRYIFPGE